MFGRVRTDKWGEIRVKGKGIGTISAT